MLSDVVKQQDLYEDW